MRYPTVGVGTDEDAQPFHMIFPLGIAMAHNGNVTNFHELKGKLARDGVRLGSSCDVEVILYVFARGLAQRVKPGQAVMPEDVFAAVKLVFETVKGAYSVVATLADGGLVAFRDPYGIKPIMLRREADGRRAFGCACASESVVLDILGYARTLDIEAGEALFVDTGRKIHTAQARRQAAPPVHLRAGLLRAARLDARRHLRLQDAPALRRGAGGAVASRTARRCPTRSSPCPIRRATRPWRWPRSSACRTARAWSRTATSAARSSCRASTRARAGVRRKLNTIPLEFEGKDVLLVDDSIVRGNTSRRIVEMARERGRARRSTSRSRSPPLVSPCPYGIDMATKTEFVAADRTRAEIADQLGADDLIYLDLERMNAAARVGNAKIEHFCNACFTGDYPTGDVTREMLMAIETERSSSQAQLSAWS